MNHIRIAAVGMAGALLLIAPLAAANHGLVGQIVGMTDGPVTARITYVGGNFNTQTWRFEWTTATGSFACNGFGSLEIGFVGLNGCPFRTGGTGDSHGYPYGQADVHQIAITVNGATGTGVQAVCPDSGNLRGCAGLV